MSEATVYYDGSCPLCAAEIRHYRKLDCDNRLQFVDITEADTVLPDDLTRQQALARFHIMSRSDGLMSGARAFAQVWANIPKWRWAAKLAGLPGVMPTLETCYSVSLLVRPALSKVVGRLQTRKPAK